jgi:NitT/TauT family transport system ATP-binding protein
LDEPTRVALHAWLAKLFESKRTTFIIVTHDLAEAISLSDKVVLLRAKPGTVKQEFDINIPRPRNVLSLRQEPEFLETYGKIWASLAEEISKEPLQ